MVSILMKPLIKTAKQKMKDKPKALLTSGPSESDSWPELIQWAFLAAAWKDRKNIKRVKRILKTKFKNKISKRGTREILAGIEACTILSGKYFPPPLQEHTPPNQVHLFLPYIATAYARKKDGLLMEARRQWKSKKNKRAFKHKATMRCLDCLLKRKKKILRDERMKIRIGRN